MDFPEKGNIMVHIEQAEPLKQLIPNTAVSGALSFLREKTERVCAFTALTVRKLRIEGKNPIGTADLEWIFARNCEYRTVTYR